MPYQGVPVLDVPAPKVHLPPARVGRPRPGRRRHHHDKITQPLQDKGGVEKSKMKYAVLLSSPHFITIQYTCLFTSRWPNPSPSLARQISLLILQRSQIASHSADLSQRRLHPLHRLFLGNLKRNYFITLPSSTHYPQDTTYSPNF